GRIYFGLICSSPCLALLGPPSRVELAPVGNLLNVAISDPLTSTQGSMKEQVPFLYYRILYWSRSDDPQGLKPKVLDSSNNLVTLPELRAWTWYCVMIQSRYDYYNKTSSYTEPQCMQTEGDTPYWQIFLYFLVSLVVCFLLVLLPSYAFFRFYRVLKHLLPLYPAHNSNIQVYRPSSRLVGASVCLRVVGIKYTSLLPSQPETGIYSTEGCSAQQGCSGGEPIRKDQEVDCWQTLAQVKMEMGRESADERDLDEWDVDVCV
uniref:Fibronectin type-III domain-containing protein n=1 Tax=Hucho hucho TaxID=62062 RepID=A0A4W5KAU7_9TELE